MSEIIEFKAVEDGAAFQPIRGSKGAAGWDLVAAEDVTLLPYETQIVRTNLSAAIPKGHFLAIVSRSSMAVKNDVVVPNSPGIIDEDYRGPVGVALRWMPSPRKMKNIAGYELVFDIKKGTRIAQAILIKYEEQEWKEVDELSNTARGTGGFGSTGTGVEDSGNQAKCGAV